MTGASGNARTNLKGTNRKDGAGGHQSNREEEDDYLKPAVENRSMPPLETPRVLSNNVISSLAHGLDASDVLECYALVRSAPLHGIANSTITIQKMAIGIRFRPTAADLKNPYNTKTPMELTLEYGPARLGPLLKDEATPIVQGNDESSSYLAWDNVGKVYFTQKIVADQFLSSHYMASMTGAVLNKLLTESVAYTEKRNVYQPFAVYSSESGRQLLRSSSSTDYWWFVWSHLAKLGVEIEPILPPSIYEARLFVKSIEKVSFPKPDVTLKAATFYKKLYNCLESIATNNFGSYLSSKANNGNNQQLKITNGNNDDDKQSDHNSSPDGNDNDRHRLEEADENDESEVENEETHDNKKEENETGTKEQGKIDNEEEENDTMEVRGENESQEVQNSTGTDHEEEPPLTKQKGGTKNKSKTKISNNETSSYQTQSPESSQDETLSPKLDKEQQPTEKPSTAGSGEDSPNPTDGIQDVEKAQNAANDAQKAADEAKNAAKTEGETKAATAAQAAADAALAAADATTSAASQAAKESLLSGDGALMSSIIGTCFSNPNFEIAVPVDINGTATGSATNNGGMNSAQIYLFRDPSIYYKLELATPYLEIAKLNRGLPKTPALLPDYGAGGDALDWTLALSIMSLLLFMVLLICQQMGNHYINAIVRCQRWFFNPRKHDYEGDEATGVQSGSHFFFGASGIPISMGGRRSRYTSVHSNSRDNGVIGSEDSLFRDEPEVNYMNDFSDESGDSVERECRPLSPHPNRLMQEVEMTSFPSGHEFNRRRSGSRDSSRSSTEDEKKIGVEIPDRLLRNPDLVELPSLKSKSKVAIPAGVSTRSRSNSGPYSESSSFAE